MAFLPSNVSGGSRLVLNAAQTGFLKALRAAVPASIPLYVTSGTRTPEAQARALVEKRRLGDNLYKLYRAKYIVKALMAVPNTVSAMSPIIARYARQGQYMSRHMRGDAVDIRSKNLSTSQRQTVMAAAKRLGAKTIYETKPPHIHVESIGSTYSDVRFAVEEKAGRAKREFSERSSYAKRSAKRAARRTRALYRQRKVLYTVSAVGGATLLIILIALATRRTKKIEAK